jgi:hypothetical protein
MITNQDDRLMLLQAQMELQEVTNNIDRALALRDQIGTDHQHYVNDMLLAIVGDVQEMLK